MNPQSSHVYVRPPVVEAVIGINFAQPITDAALATIDRRLSKHYLMHSDNDQMDLEMSTTIGADNRPVVGAQGRTTRGHRRTNPSMDEIVILMPDSLTVAQLAPYVGWEAYFSRFQRDFAAHRKNGIHRLISRVGMRYINRVDIPTTGNVVEHEQFINVYPHVPDVLGAMVGFSMQVNFFLESIGCQTNISTMPVAPVTLGHASFLVDIDIYKSITNPITDDALYGLLREMRREKNRIFEACVTERAREELFGYVKH